MPQQVQYQLATSIAPIHSFPGHTNFSTFVALSSPPTHAISTGEDRTVRLWMLNRHAFHGRLLAKTPDVGWQCSLSKDASVAAAACNDGVVRVWRTAESASVPPLSLRVSGYDVAYGAVLSDSGDILIATYFNTASIRGLVVRYRLPAGRAERQWTYSLWWGRASVSVSAHCELVALATDTGFFILDGLTGQRQMYRRVTNPNKAFDLALAGDARRVVLASYEKLKVFGILNRRRDREFDGYVHPVTPSVAVSPDGHTIVAAQKGYAFAVWRKQSKVPVYALIGHTGLVRGCALSRDGQIVVGAGVDGSVRVWDLESQTHLVTESVNSRENPALFAPFAEPFSSLSSSSGTTDSDLTGESTYVDATCYNALSSNDARTEVPSPLSSNGAPGRGITPAALAIVNMGSGEELGIRDEGRRATEPTAEAARPRRPVESVENVNDSERRRRRFSDSRVVQVRGAAGGSRLLFAIDSLVKMGIRSLGIK